LKATRKQIVNKLLETIEEKGQIDYDDGLRIIMNEGMLSKYTAIRYINDLDFQGKILVEDNKLKKVK
jgi:hypothetical protein